MRVCWWRETFKTCRIVGPEDRVWKLLVSMMWSVLEMIDQTKSHSIASWFCSNTSISFVESFKGGQGICMGTLTGLQLYHHISHKCEKTSLTFSTACATVTYPFDPTLSPSFAKCASMSLELFASLSLIFPWTTFSNRPRTPDRRCTFGNNFIHAASYHSWSPLNFFKIICLLILLFLTD